MSACSVGMPVKQCIARCGLNNMILIDGLSNYGEDPEDVARRAERWQQVRERREQRDKVLGNDYQTIPEFYRGRNVFITGGSGFVGKVILEKLLRTCPEVGRVYLLLRTRRGMDVNDRKKAILDLPIFDRLRKERPADFLKVVPIQGDCSELGLGLNATDRQMLVDTVSVVFHSAASVRFTDSIKKAVTHNTRSSRDIVNLAKEMKKLTVLVHVSTTYCNSNQNPTMEFVYPTEHNWRDVLNYVQLQDSNALDLLGPKFRGFQPNSYVFSKALSERVMEEAAHEIPIVIARPSIVTCALHDPLPSWMDNLNGFAMFWALYSKGITRVHYSERGPNAKFDLVPVDSVSDATIALSWAKGTGQPLSSRITGGKADVVNIALGDIKPSTYAMMNAVLRYAWINKKVVYPGAVRYPLFIIASNRYIANVAKLFYEVMFGAVLDTMLKALNKKPQLMQIYRKVEFAFDNMRYFMSKEFKFDTTNFWQLQVILHPCDRDNFELKVNESSTDDFAIGESQLLGVLKYALKENIKTPEEIEKAWTHMNRLWFAEMCWYAFLGLLFFGVIYWKYS